LLFCFKNQGFWFKKTTKITSGMPSSLGLSITLKRKEGFCFFKKKPAYLLLKKHELEWQSKSAREWPGVLVADTGRRLVDAAEGWGVARAGALTLECV